jgi:hypothetical protein
MYDCKHICAYMHSVFLQLLYTVWCFSKLYTDNIFVKTTCKYFQKKKKNERTRKKTAQIGTSVRARVFNARPLARSQFASRRSCDHTTRSRFSMVFLGPRANVELIPKFHIALHASHACSAM